MAMSGIKYCGIIPGKSGWSAIIINGTEVITTTLEATQKDQIVAILFDYPLKEVNAKTRHDYNDYACMPEGFIGKQGYSGGHAGWDVPNYKG